jgi:large-conductance mechanosensitive channel
MQPKCQKIAEKLVNMLVNKVLVNDVSRISSKVSVKMPQYLITMFNFLLVALVVFLLKSSNHYYFFIL